MADITDREIEHVARSVFAPSSWAGYQFDHSPSQDVYRKYARAALEAATELGWARKPTRSEFADAFRTNKFSNYVNSVVYYGFAVEDPAPEWEPTEAAVNEVIRVYVDDCGTRDESFVAVLKHIRAKPHLVGLEGE